MDEAIERLVDEEFMLPCGDLEEGWLRRPVCLRIAAPGCVRQRERRDR